MKRVLKWIGIGVLSVIALFLISLPVLNRGMGEIKALTINQVDLFSLSDGIYTGSYCKGRWCYTVEVEINTHQITDIRLVDDKMSSMKKVNDSLIKRILEKQQVAVDTYTGATVTSKALLKAVENALTVE